MKMMVVMLAGGNLMVKRLGGVFAGFWGSYIGKCLTWVNPIGAYSYSV